MWGGTWPAPTMTLKAPLLVLTLAAVLAGTASAHAMGDPGVAALQVALRETGVYRGTVDGVDGPGTTAAVVRFQQRAGLPADGVVGPKTRRALGKRGSHPYGSRTLSYGAIGWDVAALQFLLAWHGFPSGAFDGHLGDHVGAALRQFQAWAGLPADGVAGRSTYRALARPLPGAPVSLAYPVSGWLSSPFGPRGNRFHAGVDIGAPRGAAVFAARRGTVVYAGWGGDYGRLVILQHDSGVQTYYAHLSRITVAPGSTVPRGERIGLVGSSGHASGPHLHFEVRLRGACLDPLRALG